MSPAIKPEAGIDVVFELSRVTYIVRTNREENTLTIIADTKLSVEPDSTSDMVIRALPGDPAEFLTRVFTQ